MKLNKINNPPLDIKYLCLSSISEIDIVQIELTTHLIDHANAAPITPKEVTKYQIKIK
jgi:hypothetical protein